MPTRHTRTSRGTEALALLRCRGRDGKRLARGAEAACLAARAQPANPRSRRRNWIFLARTHGQVSSVDRCGPGILNGIRDGRLQLGLIVPPLKASTLHDVRYEELFHERVCVAVALQHPFARRRAIPITEVAAEPLIGLTREDYPNYY